MKHEWKDGVGDNDVKGCGGLASHSVTSGTNAIEASANAVGYQVYVGRQVVVWEQSSFTAWDAGCEFGGRQLRRDGTNGAPVSPS